MKQSPLFLLLAFVVALVGNGVAASDIPMDGEGTEADLGWQLYAASEAPVVFQGVPDFDAAGLGTGSILYPGYSAAGFLAAIFTHAAIADSAKEKQKSELQARADEVLQPYHPVLQSFAYVELIESASKMMVTQGRKVLASSLDGPDDAWLLLGEPVFSMTQDQQAIVLAGTISVYAPGNRKEPAYQNYVRVVSMPAANADQVAYWTQDDGGMLRNKSASLFARALDIAIADSMGRHAGIESTNRTFRYMEGGIERIERARMLHADCDRVLLKTLRGHLYLVPLSQSTTASGSSHPATCAQAEAAEKEPLHSGSS